jgi:hypothetical protein
MLVCDEMSLAPFDPVPRPWQWPLIEADLEPEVKKARSTPASVIAATMALPLSATKLDPRATLVATVVDVVHGFILPLLRGLFRFVARGTLAMLTRATQHYVDCERAHDLRKRLFA